MQRSDTKTLVLRVFKCLSSPKAIGILGFLGLADSIAHLLLPHIPSVAATHAASFDLSYYEANEAMFFMSAVTILIAKRLDVLEGGCLSPEGKKQDGQPS